MRRPQVVGAHATESMNTLGGLLAHALKLLQGRPHSAAELRTKLHALCVRQQLRKRAGRGRTEPYSPELVPQVMDRLDDMAFLDDAQFAAWYIAQRKGAVVARGIAGASKLIHV